MLGRRRTGPGPTTGSAGVAADLGAVLMERVAGLAELLDSAVVAVPVLGEAVAAGDAEAGQPELWTFIEFRVAADRATELAAALSRVLSAEGRWYCDFRSRDEVFVAFHGQVFRYRRGDSCGRARAEAYGRSMGVPEAQLDWPE